jgi:hypothetical protein
METKPAAFVALTGKVIVDGYWNGRIGLKSRIAKKDQNCYYRDDRYNPNG